MNKKEAIEFSYTKPSWTGAEVREMITKFSLGTSQIEPQTIKIGDIYLCKPLKHPVVIIKVTKDRVIGVLVTSSENIFTLTPCISRFISGYFTATVVQSTLEHVADSFIGVYNNPKHLSLVKKQVKQFYKIL